MEVLAVAAGLTPAIPYIIQAAQWVGTSLPTIASGLASGLGAVAPVITPAITPIIENIGEVSKTIRFIMSNTDPKLFWELLDAYEFLCSNAKQTNITSLSGENLLQEYQLNNIPLLYRLLEAAENLVLTQTNFSKEEKEELEGRLSKIQDCIQQTLIRNEAIFKRCQEILRETAPTLEALEIAKRNTLQADRFGAHQVQYERLLMKEKSIADARFIDHIYSRDSAAITQRIDNLKNADNLKGNRRNENYASRLENLKKQKFDSQPDQTSNQISDQTPVQRSPFLTKFKQDVTGAGTDDKTLSLISKGTQYNQEELNENQKRIQDQFPGVLLSTNEAGELVLTSENAEDIAKAADMVSVPLQPFALVAGNLDTAIEALEQTEKRKLNIISLNYKTRDAKDNSELDVMIDNKQDIMRFKDVQKNQRNKGTPKPK